MSLLRCYVGILADQNRISSRFLISPDKFLAICRNKKLSIDQMVEKKLISAGAAELIGKELISLLNGSSALRISNTGVQVVPMD